MSEFFSSEDLFAYARWLRKISGCKKRFIYGKKLTKFGAIAIIFSLTTYGLQFLSLRGGSHA